MRRTIGFFIEGKRVDLFQDEQISVNSSIQNVQDFSKIYTDFSKTFSIPASNRNNEIFNHFYESDVSFRNTVSLDHNIRRPAYIEIDSITFRTGKAIIESGQIKNGRPENYKVTFYGDLVSLKDTLSDTKLNEIDWSAYDHTYTFSEVVDRVEIPDTTTNYAVRYPLISGERYWQYDNPGLPDQNINTTQGAINYTELFPALRVTDVMNAIESFFGITFTGTFLDSPQIVELWLWFKNQNKTSFVTPPTQLDFTAATLYDGLQGGSTTIGDNTEASLNDTTGSVAVTVSTLDNTIHFFYSQVTVFGSGLTDQGRHVVEAVVVAGNQQIEWYIDVYKNGYYFSTTNGIGDNVLDVLVDENTNNPALDSLCYFVVRTAEPMPVNVTINYSLLIDIVTLPPTPVLRANITIPSTTTIGSQSLGINAPDIKVIDFLNGFTKMFNLTIVPQGNDTYELITLEDWYSIGAIFNITEYTIMDSIDINRVPLYKDVSFMYEQSQSLLNRQFNSLFYREYGDLANQFEYDGGKYEVKLPFENLLFQKFTDTETVVGYALNENLQGYTPKPTFLYKSEPLATDIYFTDEATDRQITQYEVFSADGFYNNGYYSLNWGAEVSPLYEAINPNGLYSTYYKAYIDNLFSRKNRLVKVEAKLPLWILTQLQLNDRLTIRDKRYIINTLDTNISTGVTKLTLLLDFRLVLPLQGDDDIKLPPVGVPPDNGCYKYKVQIPNGYCQADITYTPSAGFTISPLTLTESGYIEICVPDQTEAEYIVQEPPQLGGKLLNTLLNPNIVTEAFADKLITEDGGIVSYSFVITYTPCQGDNGFSQLVNIDQLYG